VCCVSHPLAVRGEIGERTLSASRGKCPPLLTNFDQTYTGSRDPPVIARFLISFTQLQYQARQGGKTVSASKVKRSSLLTDFDRNLAAFTGRAMSARCTVAQLVAHAQGVPCGITQ
jgi:hypothetical protein